MMTPSQTIPNEPAAILSRLGIPWPSEKPLYALTHEQVLALQNSYRPLLQGGYTPESVYSVAEKLSDSIELDYRTDLSDLMRKMGGRITYLPYHEYRGEDGSVFLHGNGAFDVILSDAVTTTRNRFTLAHELGHIVLHQPKSCSYAKRLESTPVEWEANWFAAGFLMPKRRFLEAAKRLGNNQLALASLFGVSKEAARIRLEVLHKQGD